MGTLRFFEEVVSFKIRRTFGFADYNFPYPANTRCRLESGKNEGRSKKQKYDY